MDPQSEIRPGLPDPARPLPAGWWGTVEERFRRRAGEAPERPAVVEAGCTWTYGELARASARLAARLESAGIGRGEVVALFTGRSAALVQGMLGTLRAGAAFLVLDPAHPPGHLAASAAAARPAAWATSPAAGPVPEELREALGRAVRVELAPGLRLDPEEGLGDGSPGDPGPDDPAYVAFTSGTTGAPLAVAGSHRPLSHFFAWSSRRFGFTADDRFALLSGLAHDPLLRDVFTPLWHGAALWVPDLRGAAGYDGLAAWLERSGVTVVHLTPALGRVLTAGGAARLPALRYAFFGGDVLDSRLVRDFRSLAPNATLVSFYGTTETPQAPACHVLEPDEPSAGGPVPLGRGIDGAQLLVLVRGAGEAREPLTLARVGEIGEIAVRTPYLARGYLETSDGTAPAGRFRASPWSGRPGDRLFLTGDLGSFREDGSVVLAGRIGRQVQVRGFRVEAEGVERALLEHPKVAAAAVVPLLPDGPDGGNETSLAAFVAPRRPEAPPGAAELRRHLAARLPEPAVPGAFHLLDRLPLGPNGKVDLAALVRRAAAARGREPPTLPTPRTGTEVLLAALWSEVLGRGAVGRTEHFFEAGGHSLAAVRLISRVRSAFGRELSLDRLLDAPTLEGMARLLDGLPDGLLEDAAPLPPVLPLPGSGPGSEPPQLSPAQRRLWFLHRLDPASPAYVLCDAFRLEGALEPALLAGAFRRVVERHEALRTSFPAGPGGSPRQRIDPSPRVELPVADLRGLVPRPGPDAARLEAREVARRFARRPFDLEQGPLLRLLLVRLGGERHLLLVAVHHLVVDGWSLDLLYRDVEAAARELAAGRRWRPPPPPVRYSDFAAWQRRMLVEARLEPQLAYWRARLADPPATELATDRPRRHARSAGGRLHRWRVPPPAAAELERLALGSGATPFLALLAAFHLLLARHTGSDDAIVGFPLANRRRPELEGLIGFLVNTVVLRQRIVAGAGGETTFREHLRRVRDAVLEAHAHQDLPFERVVEALMPERDLTRNPLFQAAFAARHGPEPRPALPGLAVARVPLDPPGSRLDLEVHACTGGPGEGIEGQALYDPALFDPTTVERLFRHFGSLIEAAAARPDAPVGGLALLSRGERHQLLAEWGRPPAAGAGPPGLAHRFAERAAEAPEAVAAVDGDGAIHLSYRELAARAAGCAARLRAAGTRPGDLVALYLGRSLDLVVATLGVQAVGAAPLPVDPANPPERVAQVLDQAFASAASRVILTWEPLLSRLPAEHTGPGTTVLLDPGGSGPPAVPDPDGLDTGLGPEGLDTGSGPEGQGFAIATSGSTGRPKIMELPQQGLVALVDRHRRACGAGPGVHMSLLAAPGFDASVWEIWTALGNGATLELPPPYASMDREAVARWLAERRVEVAFLTTPLAEALLAGPGGVGGAGERPSLRWLITGGDVLRSRPPAGAGFGLVNIYGPAEATVLVTWERVAAAGEGLPPLGRPIPGVVLEILDAGLRPVPVRSPAEICLGGPGLAWGYRGRPGTTAGRFVPDPWTPSPGRRLYRTGDLGRLRPDGTLEFLGRIDQQAKIRGYRIEPGEIEAVVKEHPGIDEAAVLVETGSRSGKRLVAFVAGSLGASEESAERRVEHWRRLYDRTYGGPGAPDGGSELDLRGWISSFTGEPIPVPEMREWVETTVERILALAPRRVLEIGCGTGLLLQCLAPRTERYVGTDLSRPVLDTLGRRLAATPGLAGRVRLLEREASDFTGIPEGGFDLVILNSVAQYFPDAAYLLRVLRGALRSAAAGGAVFVGDVRSLPLLETLRAAVELGRAGPEADPDELRARVRQRVRDEEELVIDPGLFLALERELPRIASVRIEPKRGRSDNELTRYRYDATLLLDGGRAGRPRRPLEPRWLDWGTEVRSAQELARALDAGQPAALLAAGIPNARLAGDLERRRRLLEPPRAPTAAPPAGADPEDLLALGARTGYRAEVSWARRLADGAFDALFVRSDLAAELPRGAPVADGRAAPLGPLGRLASDPLSPERRQLAVRRLRAFLEERLPRYMVPSEIVLLPELPLSPNGKLDRRALAARMAEPGDADAPRPGPAPPPRTPEERRIAAIWSELLEVEAVGPGDDFFLAGGHSLLAVAVTDRIEEELGVRLPLAEFFDDPTVEGLARAVRRRSPEVEAHGPGVEAGAAAVTAPGEPAP